MCVSANSLSGLALSLSQALCVPLPLPPGRGLEGVMWYDVVRSEEQIPLVPRAVGWGLRVENRASLQ